MEMFCRQCEQTAQGGKCSQLGVCGKTPDVAALQDAVVLALAGLAFWGKRARERGSMTADADRLIIEGLFSTVTNVNFDEKRLGQLIRSIAAAKKAVQKDFLSSYRKETGQDFAENIPPQAAWEPKAEFNALIEQGRTARIFPEKLGEDDLSLREIILNGLKGMAAYADHALILGYTDESVTSFFYKALDALPDASLTAETLLALSLELGQVNLRCMEILDAAHTSVLGNPKPTHVPTGVKKGPAIIISGHDLLDLKQLLEQTQGAGVNIFTHGEMLPAHGYPGLKKFPHLAGHFGTAWQNQQKEFAGVPAAILFSTNCIQRPLPSYRDRVFTSGLVGWPDIPHVEDDNGKKDFGRVIERAKALGGFPQDTAGRDLLVGFGHQTVLSVADKIVDAVKARHIRHFFLIGGCDGARPGRNYYTELAQKIPPDCLILTLACGKFRFNYGDFGTIGDFPRLLDIGQCNDAYSAVKIASALAAAFHCTVNELPLSLILSWYEQKAVAILLTLLSLGIKNIRIGPSLPAFISKDVLNILVSKFSIKPITTPEQDLNEILGAPEAAR
jgi:hydroxylamine reductase